MASTQQAPADNPSAPAPSARLKVLIACGGTGGHLFPGVAIAQALKQRGHDPLLLISKKKIDSQAAEKYPELQFQTIPTVARPALLSLQWFGFAKKLISSHFQAKKLIRTWQPDLVLGMGGFTALLPVRIAAALKISTAIHDSNAIPGKANKILGNLVDRVLLGLSACKEFFPQENTVVTGTPVRQEFYQLPSPAAAREKLGLHPLKPTVLITGGSQGAQAINNSIKQAFATYAKEEIQLILLCGKGQQEELRAAAKQAKVQAAIHNFCSDMPAAYAAANLVVARAGASTLSELSVVQKPSILIPYPFAADDHQRHNAIAFAKEKTSVHLPQEELGNGTLMRLILAHLNDPDMRQALNAQQEKSIDAAEKIATILEETAKKTPSE